MLCLACCRFGCHCCCRHCCCCRCCCLGRGPPAGQSRRFGAAPSRALHRAALPQPESGRSRRAADWKHAVHDLHQGIKQRRTQGMYAPSMRHPAPSYAALHHTVRHKRPPAPPSSTACHPVLQPSPSPAVVPRSSPAPPVRCGCCPVHLPPAPLLQSAAQIGSQCGHRGAVGKHAPTNQIGVRCGMLGTRVRCGSTLGGGCCCYAP